MIALGAAGLIASLVILGGRPSAKTLSNDLGKVTLSQAFHLIRQSRTAGLLRQVWQTDSLAPDADVTCREAKTGLTDAYRGVEANAPLPPGEACSYFVILYNLRGGKRDVSASVDRHHPQEIILEAAYP